MKKTLLWKTASSILEEIHGCLLSGHGNICKKKERATQCYYWPNMDADITAHLHSFHHCQMHKSRALLAPNLISSLRQPTKSNQHVHADQFRPLKTSATARNSSLSITDAFTKYIQLMALPNKEAATGSSAIYKNWICRFGVPKDLITDQVKEFCVGLLEPLTLELLLATPRPTARLKLPTRLLPSTSPRSSMTQPSIGSSTYRR
jgi:hypothetical protein